MTDQARLNELAHLEKDCPECRPYLGSCPEGWIPNPRPSKYTYRPCVHCGGNTSIGPEAVGGTGKIFVLSEMVRVKCKPCRGTGGRAQGGCKKCECRGTIASTDLNDWVKAAQATFKHGVMMDSYGWKPEIERHTLFRWDIDLDVEGPEDPDPFAALLKTLATALGVENDA